MNFFLAQMGLTEDEIALIFKHTELKKLPKGSLFIKPSKQADKMYFIASGLARSYRLIDGNDVTYMFYYENNFAVDFYAYLTDTESTLFFETLTECQIYTFYKTDIEKLFKQIHQLEHLGRLMAEKAFIIMSDRFKSLQTDDLATRYQKLLSENSELLLQAPQKHIASYLGVKPESLSRMKSQIRTKE